MVFVHMEVHAEEAAVRHVLQSIWATDCLSHCAVLVSKPLPFFRVQQILLALAFSAASPDYTCSLDTSCTSGSMCVCCVSTADRSDEEEAGARDLLQDLLRLARASHAI